MQTFTCQSKLLFYLRFSSRSIHVSKQLLCQYRLYIQYIGYIYDIRIGNLLILILIKQLYGKYDFTSN